MAWEIIIAPKAAADLDEIAAYIGRESGDDGQGREFSRNLAECTLVLKTTPFFGRPYPHQTNIRRLVEGRYYIYYRVQASQEAIRVLRFWHTARRNPPRWAL